MDAILAVEAVSSQYNVKGLRRLYDQLEIYIHGLKSLGVDSESYGSLLSSVLVKKLPTEMQLLISRQLPSDDWTLVALMETLVKEIEARERTATANQPQGRAPKDNPHPQHCTRVAAPRHTAIVSKATVIINVQGSPYQSQGSKF